jgi:hypothetical protein
VIQPAESLHIVHDECLLSASSSQQRIKTNTAQL